MSGYSGVCEECPRLDASGCINSHGKERMAALPLPPGYAAYLLCDACLLAFPGKANCVWVLVSMCLDAVIDMIYSHMTRYVMVYHKP